MIMTQDNRFASLVAQMGFHYFPACNFCDLFVSTCSDVAAASEPSAEEVVRQPKSWALQEERLQEPRSLLIRLLTEGRAGETKTNKNKLGHVF